jgi:hypothetical protein
MEDALLKELKRRIAGHRQAIDCYANLGAAMGVLCVR